MATVDGTGSMWTINGSLFVGSYSYGTLNITNGGTVMVEGTTYVGYIPNQYESSTTTINFGARGGTLTTQSLYASPAQLMGTGTINTRGLVSDVNLVFDSTHGLKQTVTGFGNVAVNLDMSNPNNVGDLGAGWHGTGSLAILNGAAINSVNGYLGYANGASGTATVDGIGSSWTINGSFNVGLNGNGTLNITNGGDVSSFSGCVGQSAGVATVSGSGAKWSNDYLTVLHGTLNIINGGAVTASTVFLDTNTELIAIDVGRGSSLNVGELNAVGGTIRVSCWGGCHGRQYLYTHLR